MTRNRKNTTAITLRIDVDLLAELQSINPALLTVDPNTKKPKFRHGALGRYVSRLIREDIYQRKSIKDMSLEEIVDSIETGETGSGRYEVVSYTPDTYTVDRKEDETDDEYTDRVQKEFADWETRKLRDPFIEGILSRSDYEPESGGEDPSKNEEEK